MEPLTYSQQSASWAKYLNTSVSLRLASTGLSDDVIAGDAAADQVLKIL
jgi:hypothetical protein